MADSRLATGLGLAMLAGVALALTWAVAALLTVDRGGDFETTYAAALPRSSGGRPRGRPRLIAAGGLAATQRAPAPRGARPGGRPRMVRGRLGGRESAQPILRSLGAVVTPLTLVFVFHLVLAAPDGRVRSPAARGDRGRIRGRRL